VQDGFVFIEGPVWLDGPNTQAVLLFSDMDMGVNGAQGPPSRIRRLDPPSTFDVFVENGGSNGLALDNDGNVLAASHFEQDLVRVNPSTGALSPLGLRFEGKRFNSPNDLTVRSDGTIYFTDPDWQLAGRDNETGMTGVYRVSPALEVSLVIGTLPRPNGIALSPDEKTLYVGANQSDVLAFPVNEDGSVGPSAPFVSSGASDGLTVDCAGNLYVTAGGEVKVYAPDKSSLGSISVAEGPANVAFGGEDRRTLYITARTGLYSIRLEVPGLPY
jgi:gluconolactonase